MTARKRAEDSLACSVVSRKAFVRHKASDVIADELMAKLLEHLWFEELLEVTPVR